MFNKPGNTKLRILFFTVVSALLLAADLSFAAQGGEVRIRKIYVARHGQRPSGGDPALTELGRRQARLLGERLKAENFNGEIYASPYFRTVETAVEIAKVTGAKITLQPLIQERTKRAGKPDIKGRTQQELSQAFPGFISETSQLPKNWVYDDNFGKVLEGRVSEAIDKGLSKGGDFILVGHKATVLAALKILSGRADVKIDIPIWNCTLVYFVAGPDGKIKFVESGTGFIPPQDITNNDKPALISTQRN